MPNTLGESVRNLPTRGNKILFTFLVHTHFFVSRVVTVPAVDAHTQPPSSERRTVVAAFVKNFLSTTVSNRSFLITMSLINIGISVGILLLVEQVSQYSQSSTPFH